MTTEEYDNLEEGDELRYMNHVDDLEDWGGGYGAGHFVVPTEDRDVYVSIETVKVVGVHDHGN